MHENLALEPIEISTLSQRVTERLRDSIYKGILNPGQTLVERVVAKQLHVSQTAVREALIRLESEGLVERIPTRETRVTLVTQKQIGEVSRVRLLLEPVAFTDAYKRMTVEKAQVARSLITQMDDALRAGDRRTYCLVDLEFHRLFWRLSGDETLFKLLEAACLPLFGFSRLAEFLDGAERLNPHIELLEALEGPSEERVAAAVKDHIRGAHWPSWHGGE